MIRFGTVWLRHKDPAPWLIYPSSKLSSDHQASSFIEQPSFELHDIYRARSVLAEGNDFIQSEFYKNSQKVLECRKDILYYDCANYFLNLKTQMTYAAMVNPSRISLSPLLAWDFVWIMIAYLLLLISIPEARMNNRH